jgi:hypothetical protein
MQKQLETFNLTSNALTYKEMIKILNKSINFSINSPNLPFLHTLHPISCMIFLYAQTIQNANNS